MRKFLNQTKQLAQSVQDGVRSAFRGTLNLVKSGGEMQHSQVSALADETLQDVEVMQQFGFTSVPPAGTQAVVLPIGGKTSHGIVIATENGDLRIKGLADGEVAVYDASGSRIVLKHGKLIEVHCDNLNIVAAQKISLNAPLVEASQVVTVKGQLNGQGGMAVSGGSGASFSGNVSQKSGSFTTSGDVTAGAISLKNHHHQGTGQALS